MWRGWTCIELRIRRFGIDLVNLYGKDELAFGTSLRMEFFLRLTQSGFPAVRVTIWAIDTVRVSGCESDGWGN